MCFSYMLILSFHSVLISLYLPKLFNTALYETGLGDSFALDQVLWRMLPNSTSYNITNLFLV